MPKAVNIFCTQLAPMRAASVNHRGRRRRRRRWPQTIAAMFQSANRRDDANNLRLRTKKPHRRTWDLDGAAMLDGRDIKAGARVLSAFLDRCARGDSQSPDSDAVLAVSAKEWDLARKQGKAPSERASECAATVQ